MTEKDIIQQGETVKYIITSRNPNFNIEDDDFRVELIYGMMGKKLTIQKSEFQYLDGHWVFSFQTTGMIGPVKAKNFLVPDDSSSSNEKFTVSKAFLYELYFL